MYTVSANLCDGNDYVAHWHGGTFEDVDAAVAFWERWMPPNDEVQRALLEGLEVGDDPDDYDLQVAVWDDDGSEVKFWSEGVVLDD